MKPFSQKIAPSGCNVFLAGKILHALHRRRLCVDITYRRMTQVRIVGETATQTSVIAAASNAWHDESGKSKANACTLRRHELSLSTRVRAQTPHWSNAEEFRIVRVRMRFQFAKAASSRDTHSAAPIECLVEKSDSETAVPRSSAEPAGGARWV